MTKHNAHNERIKRQYFEYLKEAKRYSVATVDAAAEAISRFEGDTGYRDFNQFRIEQAVAFKRHLTEHTIDSRGGTLSKATAYAILGHLKRFFLWLAGQPGFRSVVRYSDADHFNASEKDARIATARRPKAYPTPDQIKYTLHRMPVRTEVERRDRALIAFTFLTGARDSAIASLKLHHVDVAKRLLDQDARDVNTKNSKSFPTYFFPVGVDVEEIVADWVSFLRHSKLWGNDDPLFPATEVQVVGNTRRFEATGLRRAHWHSASPIRQIFRVAFASAGVPYFNPHSFRKTLVALSHSLCKTPEQLKAWSQNLGHDDVLTTLQSYGAVEVNRQAEILRTLGNPQDFILSPDTIAEVLRRLQSPTASGVCFSGRP